MYLLLILMLATSITRVIGKGGPWKSRLFRSLKWQRAKQVPWSRSVHTSCQSSPVTVSLILSNVNYNMSLSVPRHLLSVLTCHCQSHITCCQSLPVTVSSTSLAVSPHLSLVSSTSLVCQCQYHITRGQPSPFHICRYHSSSDESYRSRC
jgi:hypothetical protein